MHPGGPAARLACLEGAGFLQNVQSLQHTGAARGLIQGQGEQIEAHNGIAALGAHMGDTARVGVAPVCHQDVTGTNGKAFEAFALTAGAQVDLLTAQIGQCDGVMQPPLGAGGTGFADDAAIDGVQASASKQGGTGWRWCHSAVQGPDAVAGPAIQTSRCMSAGV